MSKYAKLSVGLLAVWFAFALCSSALHLYVSPPNTPPIALGLAVITPIIMFLVWLARSTEFRRFIFSLNPRAVTLVQSVRIAGIVFLALGAYKICPHILPCLQDGAISSWARLRHSPLSGSRIPGIARGSYSGNFWESPTWSTRWRWGLYQESLIHMESLLQPWQSCR